MSQYPVCTAARCSLLTGWYPHVAGQNELYDLDQDPRELENVYGHSAYSASRNELEDRLLRWYIDTSDVVPYGRDARALPEYPGK